MNVRRVAFLTLTCLLVTACGSSRMEDLQRYAEQVKARPPGPIEPIPEIAQIDIFVYEPDDRRDPFTLDRETAQAAIAPSGDGVQPDRLRRKEELERFPLDSLRMVGTLNQDDSSWGLITTNDGTLHRVGVGNYMGQNNGQITRIAEDAIDLIEIVPNGAGQWRERPASIGLTE